MDEDEDVEDQTGPKSRQRLVERLDHMVESGRVTEEEAERVRAAGGPAEFEHAVRNIRLRHAGARLGTAVEDGSMSQAEADGLLARIGRGEHPRSIRAHLSKLRPGLRSSRSGPEGSERAAGWQPLPGSEP